MYFRSRRGHGCLSVVSVVCCLVEVSATGRSLVQRSPTDCGVSLCVIKCNNPSTPIHGYVQRDWTKKEERCILGEFAKLRKVNINSVMSVCPSVC
jgi:hypothetical protein